MFNNCLSSLAKSWYLSLISLSFNFSLWLAGTAKSTIRQDSSQYSSRSLSTVLRSRRFLLFPGFLFPRETYPCFILVGGGIVSIDPIIFGTTVTFTLLFCLHFFFCFFFLLYFLAKRVISRYFAVIIDADQFALSGNNNNDNENNNNPTYQPLRSGRIWHKVNF